MPVAILDSVALHPDGVQTSGTIQSDKKRERNGFLCAHCNRFVLTNSLRQRPRHTCKRCMHLTCDLAGCVLECNPIVEGLERGLARREGDLNLYLLRDPDGWPVTWISLPDGSTRLVRRKDT
jgi:hypothetical protein